MQKRLIVFSTMLIVAFSHYVQATFHEIKTTEDFNSMYNEVGPDGKKKYPIMIIFFSSEGCGPCQQIKPAYIKLAEADDTVPYLYVKTSRNTKELGTKYQVSSVPKIFALNTESGKRNNIFAHEAALKEAGATVRKEYEKRGVSPESVKRAPVCPAPTMVKPEASKAEKPASTVVTPGNYKASVTKKENQTVITLTPQ